MRSLSASPDVSSPGLNISRLAIRKGPKNKKPLNFR